MKATNKQTAVEFLEQQIRYYISNDDRLYDMFEQAKEMEKENIKQTWQESRKIKSECSNWNCIGDEKFHESFEQYYNETYESNT